MHTPGPWIEFADEGQTVAILPATRGGEVCAFSGTPSRADTRLIAAAPDLLAVLIDLHAHCTAADEYMRAAEFVIAKAQGK